MNISKNYLLEMNVTDIHDRPLNDEKTRSCALLYDFIEGNLNKEHIEEWVGLEVCELFNLQALLRIANKKNIEETLQIINNSNSRDEASIRLQKKIWVFKNSS